VCDFEQVAVVSSRADELEPDRQPVGVASGRQADRRVSREIDGPGQRHRQVLSRPVVTMRPGGSRGTHEHGAAAEQFVEHGCVVLDRR
jgi:hypothetical protein